MDLVDMMKESKGDNYDDGLFRQDVVSLMITAR